MRQYWKDAIGDLSQLPSSGLPLGKRPKRRRSLDGLSTDALIRRMDETQDDNEFGRIAAELERRGKQPGWGICRRGEGSIVIPG